MSIIAPSGPSGSSVPGSSPESGTPPAGGSPTPSWRDTLPDDLKSHSALQSYKDIASLAKSHIHAQSLVGADKIVLPGKEATPEQLGEFYKRLGRPDKPEGYEYKLPEGLKPEGTNQERLKAWQARLHDMGLTKAQGDRLLTEYIAEEHGQITQTNAARMAQLEADETACKQTFGDKYDENMNFVRLALNQFGSDELYAAIDKASLGNNPALVSAFANIGRALAGDTGAKGSGSAGAGSSGELSSPENAQAAIEQFHANPDNMQALMNRSHPNHAAVVARRAALFKAAYPSTKEMSA